MLSKVYNVWSRTISIIGLLVLILSFDAISMTPISTPLPVTLEQPERVTVCQLKNDPSIYNHKLVEVTGFISHGFEDFGLFDPRCSSRNGIWLEYGGTNASGTMYCCGVTAARKRPKQIVVEKIPIPLLTDARFQEFDKLIQLRPDSIIHATIVGRFFSGDPVKYPGGTDWSGYGHLGCCSLLMIQQVLAVDPHDRKDLDYGASAEQPDINKVGCGFRSLMSNESSSIAIEAQREADHGERAWAFEDPKRVAVSTLARLIKVDEVSITGMKETRRVQGRIAYEWKPRPGETTFMIVVSRPYWLSFYSSSSKKVVWLAIAAYQTFCGEGDSPSSDP